MKNANNKNRNIASSMLQDEGHNNNKMNAMIKAKAGVQNLPKRAISALHLDHVRQFILRRRSKATIKDVEMATAKFMSEEEYYLFHMDTFGLHPPMQATYILNKQREPTHSFTKKERRRHIRRNTNDTDLTPVINNLTVGSHPARKTVMIPSAVPPLPPSSQIPSATKVQNERRLGPIDVDALGDGLSFYSNKGGSILEVAIGASSNDHSIRATTSKQLPKKMNWAPKDATITEDVISQHKTSTVAPRILHHHPIHVGKNRQRNVSKINSNMDKNMALLESRQNQNLPKQGQHQRPRKSRSREQYQYTLSRNCQRSDYADPLPEYDEFRETNTSRTYWR